MILSCPQCHTKYQLAEAQLKPNGRKLRCSRCQHVFWASSEGRIAEVASGQDPGKTKDFSFQEEEDSNENLLGFDEDQVKDMEQFKSSQEHSSVRVVWIVVLILVIIGAGVYFGFSTGLLF